MKEFYNDYFNIKVGRVFVFFCAMAVGVYAHAKWSGEGDLQAAKSESVVTQEQALSPAEKILQADELQEVVDPWEFAYISTYVGNLRPKVFSYSFRDLEGNSLKPGNQYQVVSISACSAIVKNESIRYFLSCTRPKRNQDADPSPHPG